MYLPHVCISPLFKIYIEEEEYATIVNQVVSKCLEATAVSPFLVAVCVY